MHMSHLRQIESTHNRLHRPSKDVSVAFTNTQAQMKEITNENHLLTTEEKMCVKTFIHNNILPHFVEIC